MVGKLGSLFFNATFSLPGLAYKLSTITAPYYIVIRRSNQALLSLLPLRIVVNNKDIYPLLNDKPVVIPVEYNFPKVVATDGFHYSKPLELVFKEPSYYKFRVTCAIEDLQLLGGGFVLVFFYLLGFFTGFFLLKLLSFSPLLWFIYLYYINRNQFIRLRPL